MTSMVPQYVAYTKHSRAGWIIHDPIRRRFIACSFNRNYTLVAPMIRDHEEWRYSHIV
jgi:hypothetical protein